MFTHQPSSTARIFNILTKIAFCRTLETKYCFVTFPLTCWVKGVNLHMTSLGRIVTTFMPKCDTISASSFWRYNNNNRKVPLKTKSIWTQLARMSRVKENPIKRQKKKSFIWFTTFTFLPLFVSFKYESIFQFLSFHDIS